MNCTTRFQHPTPKTSRLLSSLLFLAITLATQAQAGPAAETDTERQQRIADRAALSSQERAINDLRRYLKDAEQKKKLDLRREYRLKLAEAVQRAASFQFRIALSGGQSAELQKKRKAEYQARLNDSSAILATLLANDLPRGDAGIELKEYALYLRARNFEELELKELSYQEFKAVVATTQDHRDLAQYRSASLLSLAGQALEQNRPAEVKSWLAEIEANPKDRHYPFALQKLAWASFQLAKFEEARSYLKKQIQYYTAPKAAPVPGTSVSAKAAAKNAAENALVEAAQGDLALFLSEENEKTGFSLEKAADEMASIQPTPAQAARMQARMAKLIRSSKRSPQLMQWVEIHAKRNQLEWECFTVALEYFLTNREDPAIARLVATAKEKPGLAEHPEVISALSKELKTLDALKTARNSEQRKWGETIHRALITLAPLSTPIGRSARWNFALDDLKLQLDPQLDEPLRLELLTRAIQTLSEIRVPSPDPKLTPPTAQVELQWCLAEHQRLRRLKLLPEKFDFATPLKVKNPEALTAWNQAVLTLAPQMPVDHAEFAALALEAAKSDLTLHPDGKLADALLSTTILRTGALKKAAFRLELDWRIHAKNWAELRKTLSRIDSELVRHAGAPSTLWGDAELGQSVELLALETDLELGGDPSRLLSAANESLTEASAPRVKLGLIALLKIRKALPEFKPRAELTAWILTRKVALANEKIRKPIAPVLQDWFALAWQESSKSQNIQDIESLLDLGVPVPDAIWQRYLTWAWFLGDAPLQAALARAKSAKACETTGKSLCSEIALAHGNSSVDVEALPDTWKAWIALRELLRFDAQSGSLKEFKRLWSSVVSKDAVRELDPIYQSPYWILLAEHAQSVVTKAAEVQRNQIPVSPSPKYLQDTIQRRLMGLRDLEKGAESMAEGIQKNPWTRPTSDAVAADFAEPLSLAYRSLDEEIGGLHFSKSIADNEKLELQKALQEIRSPLKKRSDDWAKIAKDKRPAPGLIDFAAIRRKFYDSALEQLIGPAVPVGKPTQK